MSQKSKKWEAQQGRNVVRRMVGPLYGRGHIVVMDNCFTSIDLFMDLVGKCMLATGTIWSNRIGFPTNLKDKKTNSKLPQGTLQCLMHDSRKICAVTWIDKETSDFDFY